MTKTMNSLDEKLMRCLEAVFPSLSPDQLRNASPETLADWNSLSAITLISVIEEEFRIRIGLIDLAGLDSYEAFREYLSNKLSTNPTEDE